MAVEPRGMVVSGSAYLLRGPFSGVDAGVSIGLTKHNPGLCAQGQRLAVGWSHGRQVCVLFCDFVCMKWRCFSFASKLIAINF